jgi:hypothetical protein
MALTVTPQILGQQAEDYVTYCYLLEPLNIYISDSDLTTEEIFIDVSRVDTETGQPELKHAGNVSAIVTRERYVSREVLSGSGVVVDLMKIAEQLHDFTAFKNSSVDDISNSWDSVVSRWTYIFEIYSENSEKQIIKKLPIIGGRDFENFTPLVDHNSPLSFLTLDQMKKSPILRAGAKIPFFTLKDISLTTMIDRTPDVSIITPSEALGSTKNCGGIIHWKSKKGGWESFGMDIYDDKKSHAYKGRIAVGLFESTSYSGGGNPYVQPSYTSVESNYSVNLKCLSRNVDDLIGLSEISGSPAIYYQKTATSKLELMRASSVTAPIKTYIQGGDFSVVLKRISNQSQRSR